MGKKSAGTRRPTAAGTDLSSHAGHRGHIQPRRRSGARIIRMSALGHSRSRAVGMDWVASCLTTKRSLSAVGDCTRPAKRTSACSIHRIPWAVHRARPRRYAKLSWSVPSAGSNSSSWTIWDPKRSRPIGFRRSRRPCIQCEAATCPDTKPAGVRCRPHCDAPLPVAANDVFLWLLGQADGSNMRRLRMLAPAML
jgi:hypothetical protein